MGIVAYARTKSYTYPNGYTMRCTVYGTSVAGAGAACATTNVDDYNQAIAFVSVFSYKNGVAKNSGSKQQDMYVTLTIKTKGGTVVKSNHALKYSDGVPCGIVQSLQL